MGPAKGKAEWGRGRLTWGRGGEVEYILSPARKVPQLCRGEEGTDHRKDAKFGKHIVQSS